MTRIPLRRVAVAATAALATLAVAATPASAAAGPDLFDAAGLGHTLQLEVGLPAAVVEQLPEDVFAGLGEAGIELDGNILRVNLSNAISKLTLAELDGEVQTLAAANPVTGSLGGFVKTVTGGGVSCLSSPLKDVSIPPDAEQPIVSFDLLTAECVQDAEGHLAVAAATVADLEVDLLGVTSLLGDGGGQLEDGAAQLEEGLDRGLQPLIDGLQPAIDQVGDELGVDVNLDEVLDVPNLTDTSFPLLQIDLIQTSTRSTTQGAKVLNVSSSTLAGLQLLNGTLCLPDVEYVTEAFATGRPGGADATATLPIVDLTTCGDQSILSLIEAGGVLEDVNVLGTPVSTILSNVELGQVADGLNEVLKQLGVSTLVEGYVEERQVAEDGSSASIDVAPLSIAVRPFAKGTALGGTDLVEVFGKDFGAALNVNDVSSAAEAAVVEAPVEEPAPEEPRQSLPRTGGGAFAALLGLAAMGGALTLRKRG